jgi:hypothetical protein
VPCLPTKGPLMRLPGWLPVLTTLYRRDRLVDEAHTDGYLKGNRDGRWAGYAERFREELESRIAAGPTDTPPGSDRRHGRTYTARVTPTGHVLRLVPQKRG